MLLSGRGTTRIKRGHRIWPNHTPRSMSIQWDTVLFGRMGSPNIYTKIVKILDTNLYGSLQCHDLPISDGVG